MVNELFVDGGIAISCERCGAGDVYELSSVDQRCSACGAWIALRRCPRCGKPCAIPPNATGISVTKWPCRKCGKKAKRDHWLQLPIGSYYTGSATGWELEHYGAEHVAEVLADPERRRIDGSIVSLSGVSGLTSGGCTVFFDRESAVLMFGGEENRYVLDYSQITSLQIGGRGDIVWTTTTSSGGGWSGGGFGAAGIVEGIVLSKVLNSATSKTTTTTHHEIETIFQLDWDSGQLTLLNETRIPDEWDALLGPVFRRLELRWEQPGGSASDSQGQMRTVEKVCPYCAETVKAAAIKCRYCGSELADMPPSPPMS